MNHKPDKSISRREPNITLHIHVLRELLACFDAWDGYARPLGNVRAGDAAIAISYCLGRFFDTGTPALNEEEGKKLEQPRAGASRWQPIETAPRDGTPIQARIPGHGNDNIIAWLEGLLDSEGGDSGGWAFVEDQEPPDCWTDGVCWEVNEDGQRSVHPTRWKAHNA